MFKKFFVLFLILSITTITMAQDVRPMPPMPGPGPGPEGEFSPDPEPFPEPAPAPNPDGGFTTQPLPDPNPNPDEPQPEARPVPVPPSNRLDMYCFPLLKVGGDVESFLAVFNPNGFDQARVVVAAIGYDGVVLSENEYTLEPHERTLIAFDESEFSAQPEDGKFYVMAGSRDLVLFQALLQGVSTEGEDFFVAMNPAPINFIMGSAHFVVNDKFSTSLVLLNVERNQDINIKLGVNSIAEGADDTVEPIDNLVEEDESALEEETTSDDTTDEEFDDEAADDDATDEELNDESDEDGDDDSGDELDDDTDDDSDEDDDDSDEDDDEYVPVPPVQPEGDALEVVHLRPGEAKIIDLSELNLNGESTGAIVMRASKLDRFVGNGPVRMFAAVILYTNLETGRKTVGQIFAPELPRRYRRFYFRPTPVDNLPDDGTTDDGTTDDGTTDDGTTDDGTTDDGTTDDGTTDDGTTDDGTTDDGTTDDGTTDDGTTDDGTTES